MPFAFHRDDLPGEAVFEAGGVLSFWPRTYELGNVVATTATYALADHEGTALGSGSATITAVGTPAVSRIDVAVTALQAATLSLDRPNTCRIAWRASGDTADRINVLVWEVVRFPFANEALVSLADLQSIRPTLGLRLRKFGAEFLGFTGTDEAIAAQAAMVFAFNARVELEGRIRLAASELGTVRAQLILDRARLARVESLLTVAFVFEADAKGIVEEAEDESSQLARHYRAAAENAWRSMGPLQYDSDADGVPDTTTTPGNSLTLLRRVQG